MSHGFNRHSEAQLYATALTNARSRVALYFVHHLIMEANGTQLHLLPERCSPIQALDALYFYVSVERLFSDWTEEIKHYPEAPGNRERLLRLPQAKGLIPALPTERARVGLCNYLSILLNSPVPEGTFVDALFCAGLVSVLLSNPELLERILSGDESWAAINPWVGILD